MAQPKQKMISTMHTNAKVSRIEPVGRLCPRRLFKNLGFFFFLILPALKMILKSAWMELDHKYLVHVPAHGRVLESRASRLVFQERTEYWPKLSLWSHLTEREPDKCRLQLGGCVYVSNPCGIGGIILRRKKEEMDPRNNYRFLPYTSQNSIHHQVRSICLLYISQNFPYVL